jgi:hypothetical protein
MCALTFVGPDLYIATTDNLARISNAMSEFPRQRDKMIVRASVKRSTAL